MNDKKISPNRQKKEKIVEKLQDKVTKSKGLVFTSYQGLTHKQLENLKKAVKALEAEFVATKNTLLKIAVEKASQASSNGLKALDAFKNATATLFLYGDPVLPLKELVKTIKEFNLLASPSGPKGGPAIKFGILEGKTLTSDELIKLSALPSQQTLLTQLVVELKSPISGFHRALSWNIQKLVLALNAVKNTKAA